jgi:hypothetical protein
VATHKAYKLIVVRDGPPPRALRVRTYEPLDVDHPPVHCAWFTERPDIPRRSDHAWIVDEYPRWDALDKPGITRFSFLRRTADIDRDEFARRWENHAALARRYHPVLQRYVQNIVVEPESEVDGIVELGFASLDDLEHRMYDSDEGRTAIAADVRTFIDVAAGWRVITRDPA